MRTQSASLTWLGWRGKKRSYCARVKGPITSRNFDYKSLLAGIVALEFEKVDRTKPLYNRINLPQSSARIVVVKKNTAVLQKFVKDLRSIKNPRHEIPALIILGTNPGMLLVIEPSGVE